MVNDAVGNPIIAIRSVWTSQKFRAACYSAIATVLSTFFAGFIAALIPKLSADQIANVMQHTATMVGGGFLAAIGGSAYVDGQTQAASGPVATQAAVDKVQAVVSKVQEVVAKAQEATSKAQEATSQAQAAAKEIP
jgi:hypothetical protein